MSLQVVRVLIGIVILIGKVNARIRPVIVEPAFHLAFMPHNYLPVLADLVLFSLQSLVVLLEPPQSLQDLVFLTFLIIFSFVGVLPKGFSDKDIMSGFHRFILRAGNYLTLILVAFALPEIRSAIVWRAEAIMTSVPIFAASLTYSSFAFAPFAPAREAPIQ